MAIPDGPVTQDDSRVARLGIREVYAFVVIAFVLYLLYLARSAIAPFLLGFLLVYMLLPIVRLVEGRLPEDGKWANFRRPIAVFAALTVTLVALAIVLTILVRPVIDQTRDLINNFGTYWDSLRNNYPELVERYEEVVPEEVRKPLEDTASELGSQLAPGAAGVASWMVGATGSLISGLIALVAVPLFTIYYLLEEPDTFKNFRRELPRRWFGDAFSIFSIVDRLLGSYTRGVVIMALIVGVITGLGYWIIGVDLWLPLAFIAFAGEIVPIIGPWIAFFISFPVILATQPDLAIPAAILFLIIQGLEGWFLAPRIEGKAVHFTKAGTLLLLAIGGALAGAIGVIFALPAGAILRALIVYGAHRLDGRSPADALKLLPIFKEDDEDDEDAEAPRTGDEATQMAVTSS